MKTVNAMQGKSALKAAEPANVMRLSVQHLSVGVHKKDEKMKEGEAFGQCHLVKALARLLLPEQGM